MKTDYLIVGQGLCGSWLSYFLMQAGASVLVIDRGTENSASEAASGIINPITGKRLARQWMGDTILPFARLAYERFGRDSGSSMSAEMPFHTFFGNSEEASFFEQKANSTHEDVLQCRITVAGSEHFNFHHGIGTVQQALLVDVVSFLQKSREKLAARSCLLNESFDWTGCRIDPEEVVYRDIHCKVIIDCTGAGTMSNPYFNRLPFALNKGEALIATIPGLPNDAIYKYAQLSIVPWKDNRFWIGSSFDWNFTDELPTEAFRNRAEAVLSHWLKLPFTLHDHFAAIRPATITRDAFAGLHPGHQRIGILNGMGSKGCSLAPFLAHNLAQHLLNKTELIKQVDVGKYRRILGSLR